MGGKRSVAPVVVALAIIGGVALFAAFSRNFWYSMIAGGPLMLGVIVAAAFVLGYFLGGMRR